MLDALLKNAGARGETAASALAHVPRAIAPLAELPPAQQPGSPLNA